MLPGVNIKRWLGKRLTSSNIVRADIWLALDYKIDVEQREVYPLALKIRLNRSLTIDWRPYQGGKKF